MSVVTTTDTAESRKINIRGQKGQISTNKRQTEEIRHESNTQEVTWAQFRAHWAQFRAHLTGHSFVPTGHSFVPTGHSFVPTPWAQFRAHWAQFRAHWAQFRAHWAQFRAHPSAIETNVHLLSILGINQG